jgi:hypothetical protein
MKQLLFSYSEVMEGFAGAIAFGMIHGLINGIMSGFVLRRTVLHALQQTVPWITAWFVSKLVIKISQATSKVLDEERKRNVYLQTKGIAILKKLEPCLKERLFC